MGFDLFFNVFLIFNTFFFTAAQTQNNNSAEENNETCEDIIEGCSNFSSQCDKINIRNGCRKTCNLCAIDAGMGNAVANQLCQNMLPACELLRGVIK